MKKKMEVWKWVLALTAMAAMSPWLTVRAQDSSTTSVAEAAKRARAQKDAAKKPATVITDDTLPKTNTNVEPKPAADGAAPGTAAAQTPAAAQGQPAADSGQQGQAAEAPSATDDAKKKAKIAELKQAIADKQSNVDLQKRLFALDSDAFYGKPDYTKDAAGKSKLDEEQSEIAQLESQLKALQEQLKALGVTEAPKPAAAKP